MEKDRASAFSEIERGLIYEALCFYNENLDILNKGTKNFSSDIHALIYEELAKEFLGEEND